MDDEHLKQYDMVYEMEGISKFKEREIPEFYRNTRTGTRSLESVKAQRGFGYQLIKACPASTITRYDTLYDFEPQTRHSHDHGFLIGLACQIVESEINRLLSEPAREIGNVMLKHLDRKKKKKPREFLEGWLENRIPTMIGVASFILMALRYALDKKEGQAIDFIEHHFRKDYTSLLSSNKLGISLDNLRNNFRNPACHGTRTFSPEDYNSFVLLCLGSSSFREWDRHGPKPDQSIQEKAVFFNHLIQSKAIPEVNINEVSFSDKNDPQFEIRSMFQKLVRMAHPDTKCHIEVQPSIAARAINRDMTFCDASLNMDFSLNSKINIGYYYTGLKGSVEVIIFDLGTTGKLTVLMPDDNLYEGRINWFPDPHRSQSITLTGATGMETVFGIATQKEFNLKKQLNLNKNKIVQEFTGQDMTQLFQQLINIIEDFPNISLAIGEFEFEITI